MRAIIAGGGTGGHIYPALAIAKTLKKHFHADISLLYVGTKDGLESDIIPREGIEYETITVEGFPRSINFKAFKSGLKLLLGMIQSLMIIKQFKPDIIVATGGYVSGPIGWVGATLGIPLVIHEQNVVPGITNKLLAPKAEKICVTFKESKKYFKDNEKIVVTGLPVREEIISTNRENSVKKLNLDKHKKTLLFMGGSRGAQRINETVLKSLKYLEEIENIQLIFLTGEYDYDDTYKKFMMQDISDGFRSNIIIKAYMHDIEYALAAADIVVGRAGAAFLAEITAKGIPAILIPYPYATENHQYENAMALVNVGGAVLIEDKELTEEKLVAVIKKMLSNNAIKLDAMSSASFSIGKADALKKILRIIEDIVK